MISIESFLMILHLIGLAVAMGSATAKLTLLIRSKGDGALLQAYVAVVKPLTRLIVLGTVLLVLTGIVWLLLGYPFTTLLIVKIVLVAAVFVLGPVIDNVIEPRFRKTLPGPGETASPEFMKIRSQYVLVEFAATGIYYVVVVMWMLR